MAPTLANGKICYLELPAVDITRSAAFYTEVFRWSMRKRGDGATAFDDTTGEVSGAFVTGRKASPPGVLFYIMGRQRRGNLQGRRGPRGLDRPADRRRPPRDHRAFPRSRWQHHRLISTAE